jgi:DNA helicase II / ATP-dependent DNA helicase PcrA
VTPSLKHLAIVAAAGSHKTEYVVTEALAHTDKRVLLTTYTLNNLASIEQRIYSKVGHIPGHITLTTWYSFLSHQWCRPYQRALLGKPGVLRGIDFQSVRPWKIAEADARRYYCNQVGDLYRDWVADFAFKANEATGGAAVRRLAEIYDEVYVDEVQDMVGYDLWVLDCLLRSDVRVVMVGDPRQHTFATNQNRMNTKYRGARIVGWLEERRDICTIEPRTVSYRCNQAICDFADALYPRLPRTTSMNVEVIEPSGILMISAADLPTHVASYAPTVLRHSSRVDTLGFPAINFGASKGGTHEHVVIFPTQDIRKYLEHLDPSKLADGTRSKLYVAVTRAKHSVAFVI